LKDLWRLEDELLSIEARVGLLEACRPIGLEREQERIWGVLSSAARPNPADLVPRLQFPIRPLVDPELVRLEQALRAASGLAGAETTRILAGRAEELVLDAELVRARGTPDMVSLARRRFVGSRAEERKEADRTAAQWIEQAVGEPVDDEEVLLDLAAELRRLLLVLGLAIEVREVDMAARAAVSDQSLLARSGARVTRRQAARIVTHEVFGHFLPRKAGRINGPPFRIGPRGADADEEGRALHLELVGGYVDTERRLELAVRHVLAAHVLDGGHIGEKVASLHAQGVAARLLSTVAPRVSRAGGLCREVIYLPGLLRVGPRLADPEVELVFRAGRATLAEVGALRRLLPSAQSVQSSSATTGV
jgi:hypothetical protein